MDRETKFRFVILFTAAAISAVIVLGAYMAQPIQLYQVVVQATAAPAQPAAVTPAAGPVSSGGEEEELTEPDPEGPQEVLVEKSVNINTASLEELDKLPGVGPSIAQRIIDYREENSGFYDIQELMDVSGIGEKTFQKLEPYITAE